MRTNSYYVGSVIFSESPRMKTHLMITTVVSRPDDYIWEWDFVGHSITECMSSRRVPGLTITDWRVPELRITVLALSRTDDYDCSVQT